MILNMAISDGNGRSRPGTVRMKLDLGAKQWAVAEDLARTWPSVGFTNEGPLELKGGGVVAIMGQPPGKLRQNIVTLMNVPASDLGLANAGTGRIVAAKDTAFTDGGIFWAFERSSIREAMKRALKKWVPMQEMSSDDPAFKTLTGFDTDLLRTKYWENPTKPNTTFTTCNLFLGAMAGKVGAEVGKTPGPKLTPACWN